MVQQVQGGQIYQPNSLIFLSRPTEYISKTRQQTNAEQIENSKNTNGNGTTTQSAWVVQSSKQTQYHKQVVADWDGDKREQGRKSLTQQEIAMGLLGSKKAKAKSDEK